MLNIESGCMATVFVGATPGISAWWMLVYRPRLRGTVVIAEIARTTREAHTVNIRGVSTFSTPHGILNVFVFGSARARFSNDASFAVNESMNTEVERIHPVRP